MSPILHFEKGWLVFSIAAKAMTMIASMMPRTLHGAGIVSRADASLDEHERLDFEILAVDAGGFGDVEDPPFVVIHPLAPSAISAGRGGAMTVTASMSSRKPQRRGTVSRADVSFEEHERLALEMLAVETGDVADVKNAMRKIIASAPDGANVALLLSLALSRASDRVLAGEAPKPPSREVRSPRLRRRSWPVGPNHERALSRGWVAAAMPFFGLAALFWWLGALAIRIPAEGSDTAGMAAMLAFGISIGSLGIALIGVETLFLLRWQSGGPADPPVSPVRSPGWYTDPLGKAPSRWWNGFNWTGRINKSTSAGGQLQALSHVLL
jgi:hypothetical protein